MLWLISRAIKTEWERPGLVVLMALGIITKAFWISVSRYN